MVALESPDLVDTLKARLRDFGLDEGIARKGALAEGSPSDGPFDVILVNGAVETGLDALIGQLAEGGRLVAIRRSISDPTGRAAKAMCWEKRGMEAGTRYLFDASAPVLPAFRSVPRFTF